MVCDHCVISWKWHTGNNWGCEDSGECGVGLGPQEEFWGCADIAITPDGKPTGSPPTTTPRDPSQPDVTQFCIEHGAGIFPHPTDCSSYIKCNTDSGIIEQCPAGTLFNPTALFCDWESNVTCNV